MKLGSLFDGIGGFPLVGTWFGIEPVWASEIEPAPISITKRNLPTMKHLGDITQINGGDIEPVDIITFGSPCQNLSMAGDRSGLAGSQSGLFLEAIRIINEMREATSGIYPKFIIWENVRGALSSSGGSDLKTVFSEITETDIPIPASGRWANAGLVRSARCDLAWRILDAQHWGVPQRRERIFIIGDFRADGERRPEVLFESESLYGHFAPGETAWEETASDTGSNADRASIPYQQVCCYDGYNGLIGNVSSALGSNCGMSTGRNGMLVLNDQGGGKGILIGKNKSFTIAAAQNQSRPSHMGDGYKESDVMYTLNTIERHAVCYDARGNGDGTTSPTITGNHNNRVTDYSVLTIDRASFNQGENAQYDFQIGDGNMPTLVAKGPHAVCHGLVRRITPKECERLQGFPDDWTRYGADGEEISDTQRYKALGNSVALPCVEFVLGKIKEEEK